jgi:quercetin dioxygenase-like cupin family protein
MKNPNLVLAAAFVVAGAMGAWGIHGLEAQEQAPFKRTILQTQDLSTPGRAAVVVLLEAQPNAVMDRHTHPGEEIGYVLEGTIVVEVEGKPPLSLKAGQTYIVEAGKVHGGKVGGNAARILATYVVEKGKPFATAVK